MGEQFTSHRLAGLGVTGQYPLQGVRQVSLSRLMQRAVSRMLCSLEKPCETTDEAAGNKIRGGVGQRV